METFKKGAVMALGAITALAVLAGVVAGGVFAYEYFTTDHDRLTLVEKVRFSCRNGRGEYREPPSTMSAFQQMDYIEGQRDGIGECAEAKMRLMAYDMDIDLDK
ncbi:hypothetical protein [Leisingera daeponensis]|uniref:hypothetical protein n=1 Tax=Leisingera daeponensis TaxID=405746 RepID=UPI001C97D2ED|nr:hypothetical protein [Leisingera daeponensis]MBY6056817.1 hypothetical protein [Leisingera daeponensis]